MIHINNKLEFLSGNANNFMAGSHYNMKNYFKVSQHLEGDNYCSKLPNVDIGSNRILPLSLIGIITSPSYIIDTCTTLSFSLFKKVQSLSQAPCTHTHTHTNDEK